MKTIKRLSQPHTPRNGPINLDDNSSRAITALAKIQADGIRIITEQTSLDNYAHDEALTLSFGRPSGVVFPKTTEQVSSAMKIAHQFGIPVVARGAGSGLSGGANAIEGCIILSLESMNDIISIDANNMTAVVQPGVINGDLKDALRPFDIIYPPDPASFKFSTIGGNIATNAGGLCCVKYGVTRDFVLGLNVVLANGAIINTGRRSLKGVAGYDLTALIVGSEGTLGIVTEATLSLRPSRPQPLTMLAFMPSMESAGKAIQEIRRKTIPSLLELMDQTTMESIEEFHPMGLDTNAAALIIAQSDTGGDQARSEISQMSQTCEDHGATLVAKATEEWETEAYLEARRLALPSLQMRGTVILDDIAVPTAQIPTLLNNIDEIANKYNLTIGTFGHAGDGNMHPTIVYDKNDEVSVRAAKGAFREIISMTLKLGGTITGEHGVGVLKRGFLRDELDSNTYDLHRAVKQTFDPKGLLNPGKLID